MTKEEAEEYAKTMTYREAIYNLTQAKCIPYRRATLTKVYELLDILDKIRDEIETESAESFGYPNWERAKALKWALSIIDKYNTENGEGGE